MSPFFSNGVDIDLVIWWSNKKTATYNLRKVFSQIAARIGAVSLDPYYESFLTLMASVAINKEGIARTSRANKQYV